MLFGYFLHNAKSDNPFSLQRTSRFSEPRISAPEQQLLTNKIKTFPKGASRFCKPRFSAQNQNFAQTNLNPLPLRGFPYFLLDTKSMTKSLLSLPGRHASRAFAPPKAAKSPGFHIVKSGAPRLSSLRKWRQQPCRRSCQ